MNVREMRNEVLGNRVVKALESRNMEAYYVKTKEEALAKALELIPEGSSISWGGTMSAQEIGLTDALHKGNYDVYDREQVEKKRRKRKDRASGIELRFLYRQHQRAFGGRSPCKCGRKCKPCGGVCLWTEERTVDRRDEQSREDRGGCDEPRKK